MEFQCKTCQSLWAGAQGGHWRHICKSDMYLYTHTWCRGVRTMQTGHSDYTCVNSAQLSRRSQPKPLQLLQLHSDRLSRWLAAFRTRRGRGLSGADIGRVEITPRAKSPKLTTGGWVVVGTLRVNVGVVANDRCRATRESLNRQVHAWAMW